VPLALASAFGNEAKWSTIGTDYQPSMPLTLNDIQSHYRSPASTVIPLNTPFPFPLFTPIRGFNHSTIKNQTANGRK